ncbi:hypothetical protein FPOAC2_11423 [Fusarium poae]
MTYFQIRSLVFSVVDNGTVATAYQSSIQMCVSTAATILGQRQRSKSNLAKKSLRRNSVSLLQVTVHTYLPQTSGNSITSLHRPKSNPLDAVIEKGLVSKSNLQMLRILGPVTSFQFPSSTP